MKITRNLQNNFIVTPADGEPYVVPAWDTEKHAEIEAYIKAHPKSLVPYVATSMDYQVLILGAQQYLDSTDWYITRSAETGIETPAEILEERQKCRGDISGWRIEAAK
jgi:hypothetical protein